MTLLFTLRVTQKPNIKNLIGLIISNALIVLTHTIGFVFVFFDLLFVSLILFKENNCKKKIIIGWCSCGIAFLAMLPLIYRIFTTISFSQWWAKFSIRRILQVFVDFFTPVISQILPIEALNGYHLYAGLIIIATLIALIVIIIGLFNPKAQKNNLVFYIAFAVFLVMIFAAMLGKIVFEAKYMIEIYPILIFVFFNTVL